MRRLLIVGCIIISFFLVSCAIEPETEKTIENSASIYFLTLMGDKIFLVNGEWHDYGADGNFTCRFSWEGYQQYAVNIQMWYTIVSWDTRYYFETTIYLVDGDNITLYVTDDMTWRIPINI